MGIITFRAKKIYFFFLVTFLLGIANSFAQCPTVADNTQSFCDLQSPTVASLVAVNNGGGVVWYANATGGSPLSSSSGLVNGEDYFADSTAGGCSPRQEVTVSIYAAPTGQNFQGVCVGVASDAQIEDLIANGNNIQWYSSPAGGSPLSSLTQLVDNTIYYASQTNPDTGCETSRLSVFVNVGVVPTPAGPVVQQFCNDPNGPARTLADLVASGVNNWYPTAASAVQLPLSTPLVNGQSYFATTVDPPCESTSRLEVQVQLVTLNNPGTNGTRAICQNQVASTPPFNLFGLLGGTPDATGTWSGPLVTSNGHLGTVNVSTLTLAGSPYVFTYNVNNGVCASSSSTVTITLLPLPTASVIGSTTICSGSNATIAFTGTPNATVTYTISGVTGNQTIVLNASGSATLTAPYSATATISLVSVASSGTPSCSQAVAGSVTITVLPLPTATIASSVSVCSGGNATVTFTGTPNATVTYTVTGVAGNQAILLNAAGTGNITNTFTATTTYTLVSVATSGSPSCSRPLTGNITVTVIQLPVVAISGSASVCPNGSATITFTGTPNATVTYTVTGVPGNQTIVLNGSGTATITGNYTTATTFTLVSVATAGTPSCSRPQTGTATITVLPLPTASIAAGATICSGGSFTVNFTGTANATVTYTVTGVAGNQTIVLNGSGTASITNTYTSTTIYTLVSVASPGTPSCSQPLTSQITITVLPLPMVSISGSASVCPNGSATVTFTGTPNATVTYTVTGVPGNQTIVLNGSGTATIPGTYSATTTYTLVSVATTGSPACSRPQTGNVTITVLPLPVASISPSTTVCAGASSTVTFTGTPNATITYTVTGATGNQTIVLNAVGSATLTATYSATTTYTLVSVTSSGTPSCSQPLTMQITITVLPLPTVAVSPSTTICSGNPATVTFTGTPNATVTYTVTGATGNQTIVLNGAGTASMTNTYTSTTTFTLVGVATSGTPSCSRPLTAQITITVLPPPTVTVSPSVTVCSGSVSTVTFTGTPNATVTYSVTGVPGNQSIVLNGSGTATITGTYTATTTFTLVSITTPGTPSCTQPLTASMTITVIQLPIVAISGTASICPNGQGTITFTGTPNATVTYTVTGLPGNQTIILNASGTAIITGAYSATTTYTIVSVATAGTPSCSQPQTGNATITVLPPPTVTISSSINVCSGGSATVIFTGTPNAVITYTVTGIPGNQTITLNAAGTATITNTFTSTTTYSLVSAATAGTPGCSQIQTGSMVITVLPLPVVSLSTNVTICTGSSATVTFTGTPNATVTYTVTGIPGNQTIVLNAAGTAIITNNYPTTTTFTVVSVATAGTPSCNQPQTATMTVTVLPLPTVTISAASTSVCTGTAGTVTFTGTPNATVTYIVTGVPGNQTIVLSTSGTATVSGSISATTTYTLVSISTSGTPSCGQPQTGTVTITSIPPPIAGNDVANLQLCTTGPAVDLFALLGATAQPGGTWSPAMASGTGVFNPAVDAAGAYTYTVTGNAPCPNDTATVNVSIVQPSNAGNDAAVNVCSNASQDLFPALGNSAQTGGTWSPALSSGTSIFNPLVDVAGTYTYTVTGVSPCGTDSATVTVSITPAPIAGQNGSVAFCANGTSQNLFNSLGGTPQSGGTWSPPLASGTGVFNPFVDAAGTYMYTVTGTSPCPNASASVTVSIIPPPNAGNDASVTVCSNATSQNLFTSLGSLAQAGGIWSPALVSGTGFFNPLVDLAGTYTYTVTGVSPCGADTAAVAVSIITAPNAGLDGNVAFCTNGAPQNLFNSLGGTPQAGGTWSPVLASGTGVFNPFVDAAGVYTYTVTGTSPCPNDTAVVNVSITLPPNAGNDATVNICSNANPQDLFALLGSAAQSGGTWSPALASGTGVFDPVLDIAGNYTYTVSGTSPCGNDTAVVNATITPGPNAGQNGTMTVCVNSASQDLFNFLGGTPMTGGTWSPVLASGTGIFNPTIDAAGVYTYTFFGNQPCDNDTATVTVTVNPIPDAGVDGTAFFCTNYPAADLFISLGGTPQLGGTWSPALASGTGVFNPLVDTAGTYTYSVGGNLCSLDTATVTVSVTQSPNAGGAGVPLLINTCVTAGTVDLTTALNGSQGIGTWNDNDASGALSGNIFNATAVVPGTYHFTYTVTGGVSPCTSDAATVTVIVAPIPNAGIFGGMQSVCTSAGTFDLAALLNGEQSGGVWTDGANNTLTNPVNVATLAAGTYSYTYTITNACGTDPETVQLTILPVPIIGVPNITLVTPICFEGNAVVNLAGVADGTYNITYDLSGSNVLAAQSVAVTVVGGNASFTIPAASMPNAGTTTISFTNIANTVTSCSNTLSNVQVNLVIRTAYNLENADLAITNVCLGSLVNVNIAVVNIGANSLPDGNYQFNYSIPGATPASGTTGIIAISGGVGQFSVPATSFATAGNFTLTITGIINLSTSCSTLSENAAATFTILPVPNVSGATVSAGNACINFSNQVTITGASSLADGVYNISYDLSGANTATGTAQVTINSGNGNFTIPASQLANAGNVTLTITQLVSTTGICGAGGTNFNVVVFNVSQLGTPVLIPQGEEFCQSDNPTIAILSANIIGSDPVMWYDAASGGTAYASTDLLVNGATYFAAYTAGSGCESASRLPVIVDLTVCDDILIPDGFSPNEDGVNDEFVIVNLPETYPGFRLEIYNRYGNILYKGNINTPNWDGTSSQGGVKMGGNVLPVGVYFYILEFNDGTREPVQGRVYLSR
jgi:mucin-2